MNQPANDMLVGLSERCEWATGPIRMLDCEIARALAPGLEWREFEDAWGWRLPDDPDDGYEMPLNFTDSIDDALTLRPDGWEWLVRSIKSDRFQASPRFFARMESPDFHSATWGKGECWITDIVAGQEAKAEGASAALAICAAALLARAQQGDSHE